MLVFSLLLYNKSGAKASVFGKTCCPRGNMAFKGFFRAVYGGFLRWKQRDCCSVAKSWLTLCDTWSVALQALLSMEFSRQEQLEWFAIAFSENLPNPGIEPRSPPLQAILYCLSHQGRCDFHQMSDAGHHLQQHSRGHSSHKEECLQPAYLSWNPEPGSFKGFSGAVSQDILQLMLRPHSGRKVILWGWKQAENWHFYI